MDPDVALYDALTQLSSEAQWVNLRTRAQVNSASMPATSAAPVMQADALARLAAGDPALDARLREFLGSQLGGDPSLLRRWLARCHADALQIWVPGPERDLPFDTKSLRMSLRLRPRPRSEGHLGYDPQADDEPQAAEDYRTAFRAAERRQACAGIAVVGDPGSGKSTLLQQIYCDAYPVTHQDLGVPAALTPVLVRCRDMKLPDTDTHGWQIQELVAQQAKVDGFTGAAQALKDSDRPLLVLLDGLDEMADEVRRIALANWLGPLMLSLRHAGWRFVVSSRYATWGRQTALSDALLTTDALSFDRTAIRDYLARWFRAVACVERVSGCDDKQLEAQAAQQADALWRALDAQRGDSHMAQLMGNPLSLALLCQVHTRHQDLPKRRAELYEACLRVFLERRPKVQKRPHLPAAAAQAVLQPLAWAMQHSGRDDWRRTDIEAELRGTYACYPDLASQHSLAQFVNIVWQQCGLLRARDYDTLGFFHASVREYLAAKHALATQRLAHVAEHADDDRWRLVALLVMSLPGGFSAFVAMLAERGLLAAREDLVREGQHGLFSIEPEPLVALLDAARPARGGSWAWWRRWLGLPSTTRPTTEDVLALLRLLEPHPLPPIVEAVATLTRHPDEHVVEGARRYVALVRGEHDGADGPATNVQPGTAWRDPRTGMVFIWHPPGEFWMGSSKEPGQANFDADAHDVELSAHYVRLSAGFWLAQHPVTNEVYRRFVQATKHPEPEAWRQPRLARPDQPVVTVSYDDAVAFCKWASRERDDALQVVLPSETQWEYAARVTGGTGTPRRYPWGDEAPTARHAVFEPGPNAPASVGGRAKGATPLEVHDLAGNVWEWCRTPWTKYPATTPAQPRLDPDDGKLAARAVPCVVRGGSWVSPARSLRAACRYRSVPGSRTEYLGFRVVCRRSRQHVGPS